MGTSKLSLLCTPSLRGRWRVVLVVVLGVVIGIACDGGRGQGADARSATTPPVSVTAVGAPVGSSSAPAVPPTADASTIDGGPTDAAPSRSPLRAPDPLIELPLEGYDPAVVWLPLGATSPRPLVVVTHGNYDRPEWQCGQWSRIVGSHGFVLCPRGKPRADSPARDDMRYSYPNNRWLEEEIDVALAALRARYGEYLAEGRIMYAGFSQGAIMGVAIAARHPTRFGPLVLIEGGTGRWTAARVKAYAAHPDQRVLFVCGQKGCDIAARNAAARLQRAGVEARHALVPGQGHSYGGPLNSPILDAWHWLVAGDERWSGPHRSELRTQP
ncbi:MAG: hypothetical protein JRI23_34400 [Deltaproteobacteria bacterium]|jgi:pimeloyl-ACP methyl ester carboxylesterase|nr:hypothetical protein [Deltaproteobacteria bacterium]MBW2537390.1 hypothetical protein [Deltaproteobacteria bacterium]